MSNFIPIIELEESSKILSELVFEVLRIPPQIRLPRHPQLGTLAASFILMSNPEADVPNIPDGIITGVLHFRHERENKDYFLRLRFNTNTGQLEIGNDSRVLDVHRSITSQIEAQIEGETAKALSVSTSKLSGHWRVAGAVSAINA